MRRKSGALAAPRDVGDFVQYLRAIFDKTHTRFEARGREDNEGAACLRYDYDVPQGASDFRIGHLGKSAFVGFHGSVWVSAVSLNLARLEVVADEIPVDLGVVTSIRRDLLDLVRRSERNSHGSS